MNILKKNFYNYFVTERSRNNTLYGKFLLNCKQHSKTRKEFNLKKELNLNVFLIRLLYFKDMVETYYIKSVQKQMFYKTGVLKYLAKLTGKNL